MNVMQFRIGRYYRRKVWNSNSVILVDKFDKRSSFTLYTKGVLVKRDYPLIADDVFATDWIECVDRFGTID